MKSPARLLVLVSASTGAVDRRFPDVDADVSAVASDGQTGWFVAGGFTCVGGVKASALAHLDRNGNLDRGWHPGLPVDRRYENGVANVTALFLSGSTLYVGGSFGVEALDAATGRRLWRAPIAPIPQDEQIVYTLAVNTQAVFVGGEFTRIDGKPQPSLAALDPRTGRLLNWHPPSLGHVGKGSTIPVIPVFALALADSRLFVGGPTSFGGKKRPQIAALVAADGALTDWMPATAPHTVKGFGVGDVDTILIAGTDVFTAGHDGFGITDATTGQIEPAMRQIGGASRFAGFGNITYLGGDCRNSFSSVAGQPRNNLAALDITTGKFTSWAPKIAPYTCVNALAANADNVLVAGGFSKTIG
jgi:hypothetical protein